MATHVVVGRGAIGTALAALLRDAGHEVRQVSRGGGAQDGIEPLALDAADQEALAVVTKGADALYNCVNPPYDAWPDLWPPLAASFLHAAERSGAVLVTTSNLYGDGPVDRPMTEDLPLAGTGTKARVRAGMWRDALARHEAGRVRVTEARASDYYGPGVTDTGFLAARAVPPLLEGRPVRVLGDPDAAHTFTYVPDIARTLAVLAVDERAWGRPWHVPSAEPLTQRRALARMADLAGAPTPDVRPVPAAVVRVARLVSPLVRELGERRPTNGSVRTSSTPPRPRGPSACNPPRWRKDSGRRCAGGRTARSEGGLRQVVLAVRGGGLGGRCTP